jgi:hypothetical protein
MRHCQRVPIMVECAQANIIAPSRAKGKTMRPLAVALIASLFAVPSPARAALITAYGTGSITSATPSTRPEFREFVIGERVDLVFSYDPDQVAAEGVGFRLLNPARYHFDTYTVGARWSGTNGFLTATDGPTDRVDIGLGGVLVSIDLAFVDPAGGSINSTGVPTLAELGAFPQFTMTFDSEVTGGGRGFVADMALVSELPPVAAPEPAGLAMGLVGAALAGLGWARRRWAKA